MNVKDFSYANDTLTLAFFISTNILINKYNGSKSWGIDNDFDPTYI